MSLNTIYIFQIRIYSVAIPDAEILDHVWKQSLDREVMQGYVKMHLKMQEVSGEPSLSDYGPYNYQVALHGTRLFVDVSNIAFMWTFL